MASGNAGRSYYNSDAAFSLRVQLLDQRDITGGENGLWTRCSALADRNSPTDNFDSRVVHAPLSVDAESGGGVHWPFPEQGGLIAPVLVRRRLEQPVRGALASSSATALRLDVVARETTCSTIQLKHFANAAAHAVNDGGSSPAGQRDAAPAVAAYASPPQFRTRNVAVCMAARRVRARHEVIRMLLSMGSLRVNQMLKSSTSEH
jgi:hypothetical protein